MSGNGPEFFQTGMGRRFFESTMPELVEQLKLLNKNLAPLPPLNVPVGTQVPLVIPTAEQRVIEDLHAKLESCQATNRRIDRVRAELVVENGRLCDERNELEKVVANLDGFRQRDAILTKLIDAANEWRRRWPDWSDEHDVYSQQLYATLDALLGKVPDAK